MLTLKYPQLIFKGLEKMKYISLVTLTLQNAALGLSMRYARTRPGDLFLSSTGIWKYNSNNNLIDAN